MTFKMDHFKLFEWILLKGEIFHSKTLYRPECSYLHAKKTRYTRNIKQFLSTDGTVHDISSDMVQNIYTYTFMSEPILSL